MNNVDFRFKGTKVFKRIAASPKKVIVVRGGTGASKTYSLAQIAVLFLFSGWIGKDEKGKDIGCADGVFSVVRKSLPSLRASGMRDFLEILHRSNLYRFVKHNMSENTFSYQQRMVEFFSVDDEQKVRSRTRKVLWILEANEMSFKKEFFHLAVRTDYKIYMDFNPDDDLIWINTQIEQKRAKIKGDVEVIVCNYTHNPFLSRSKIEEIEYLKEDGDETYWTIFGTGEYGKIQGLIYDNWKVSKFPKEGPQSFFGLDFGFAHDPTALIEMKLLGNVLYCQEIIYMTGLTSWALGEMMRAENIRREKIWADPSSAITIAELKAMGFNISGAPGGPGSVEPGISSVQSRDVRVTENSLNIWMERRRYKWKVNRLSGETEPKPFKANDHAMDGIRYGEVGNAKKKGKPTFTHIRK